MSPLDPVNLNRADLEVGQETEVGTISLVKTKASVGRNRKKRNPRQAADFASLIDQFATCSINNHDSFVAVRIPGNRFVPTLVWIYWIHLQFSDHSITNDNQAQYRITGSSETVWHAVENQKISNSLTMAV